MWARGNRQILLEAGYQMQPERPLTLGVTAIEEYAKGKFKVDNALRERLARMEGTLIPAPVKTLEAIVTPIGEVQEDQLDSIPF